MLVHGEATPARHQLDDLLAQEGTCSRLSAAAVAVTNDIRYVCARLISKTKNPGKTQRGRWYFSGSWTGRRRDPLTTWEAYALSV